MNWNLLLEWVSEFGGGSWPRLRDACAWLGARGTSDRWWSAHQLSCFGHLEIDWDAQRWAAPPPALTMLPRGGGFAIAAGGRTRSFRVALEEAAADRDTLWLTVVGQHEAPDALFIQCEDEREVARLAADIGVAFDELAADRIGHLLPETDAPVRAYPDGPPNRGFETVRFDADAMAWTSAARMDAPGLYRVEVYWRHETWWSPAPGRFGPVPQAEGMYLELARRGRNVLHWEADARSGTFIVPQAVPLPVLQARAAFLCSGLAPSLSGGALHYVNVPYAIAGRISRSLRQELEIARTADPAGPAVRARGQGGAPASR
jgi:hypothetical protein